MDRETCERSKVVKMILRESIFLNLVLTAFVILFVSACSTGQINISSNPAGAKILTINGESIGETPKTLTKKEFEKILVDKRATFILEKDGYASREVIFDVKGVENYEFKLNPLDKDYFKTKLLSQYPKEANELIREVLSIQGLIMNKKTAEAEKRVEEFQKNYPTVAAGFVLGANLAMLKNDKTTAQSHLLRAQSLDPQDPVVIRLLKNIKGEKQ